MLAVHSGDLNEAEKQLMAAGDTPGSPQLNSFGPNTSLAKALLERGRTKAVLEFLQKCSKFWRKPDGTINERCSMWIQQLELGQTPDLRPNMVY